MTAQIIDFELRSLSQKNLFDQRNNTNVKFVCEDNRDRGWSASLVNELRKKLYSLEDEIERRKTQFTVGPIGEWIPLEENYKNRKDF